MTRPALLALAALAALATACSSPGTGVSYFPPSDTTDSDGVLDPDALFPRDTGAAADTAAPPDTTPVDTATPVDTTPPPTCTVGNACTDNDPCTVNDQCVAGQCKGQALTCDDNNPCTVDSCSNATCQHAPPPGQCLIGGACVPDQQPNPANACQRCIASTSDSGWSNADGAACDDQNSCTSGEQCSGGQCTGGVTAAEVCGDNIDNDCNGATDDADDACNPNPPCAYHTDCFPDRVCGYWPASGGGGANHCSDPCASTATCAGGQVCVKVPGSMQIGFCRAGVPGTLVNGAGCSVDADCASGLCSGVCMDLCLSEFVCAGANTTCQAVGDLNAGVISSVCGPNPPGTINNGSACTTDNDNYDPALCASGHCDFMNFALQALNRQQLTGPATCKALCKSELDCLPSSEECNIVLYATSENPQTVPPSPSVQMATHDTLSACYTPAFTGSGPVGQMCSQNSDCSSAKCLPGVDDDNLNQGYCASYCEFDQECPSTMSCQLAAVSINSQYLQITSGAFDGFQAPAESAFTLVRICKFQ